MLDVQNLLILGSRMGLLAYLIILSNFLLRGRTRRKSIREEAPNKGAEPGGLSTSLQGSWGAQLVPAAGLNKSPTTAGPPGPAAQPRSTELLRESPTALQTSLLNRQLTRSPWCCKIGLRVPGARRSHAGSLLQSARGTELLQVPLPPPGTARAVPQRPRGSR